MWSEGHDVQSGKRLLQHNLNHWIESLPVYPACKDILITRELLAAQVYLAFTYIVNGYKLGIVCYGLTLLYFTDAGHCLDGPRLE